MKTQLLPKNLQVSWAWQKFTLISTSPKGGWTTDDRFIQLSSSLLDNRTRWCWHALYQFKLLKFQGVTYAFSTKAQQQQQPGSDQHVETGSCHDCGGETCSSFSWVFLGVKQKCSTKTAYYQLQQDLLAHPVVQAKIPPVINEPLKIVVDLFPIDILELEPSQHVMSMSSYIISDGKTLHWVGILLTVVASGPCLFLSPKCGPHAYLSKWSPWQGTGCWWENFSFDLDEWGNDFDHVKDPADIIHNGPHLLSFWQADMCHHIPHHAQSLNCTCQTWTSSLVKHV